MRLLSVSAVFCLTLFFSTAQAQTSASNGQRFRFVLSIIDKRIVRQFNEAWQQAALGTKDTEAVVLVLRESDGSIKAISGGCTNQSFKFTFTWNSGIIAIVHTHPNNRDPKPQEQDILVARRFDVPILTITLRGMYMYDPASDRITKIKSGTDWLDASNWLPVSLAANEHSQR
jgi:hypothetical protein